MIQQRLQLLLEKYMLDTLTVSEQEEMDQLLETPQGNVLLEDILQKQLLQHTYETEDPLPAVEARVRESLKEYIRKDTPQIQPLKPHRSNRRWQMAAAVLLLIIGTGMYMLLSRQTSSGVSNAPALADDRLPGGNKAVLTLANGTKITLDSAGNGSVAQQGNTNVIKLDSGQLAYNVQGSTDELTYNTLATPRGGQFQVTLPDGTKVWLNAASSLRFPTAFTGHERRVELSGEAYFEVAASTEQPFRVVVALPTANSREMMVEVLGTHFNINAYPEEKNINTTLLDGAVKAITGNEKVIIQPGQQASLPITGNSPFLISQPNTQQIMAWKNGYFRFKGDNITTIMQQLARWYDIIPVYVGDMQMKNFSGTISRNENISGVLKMLEATDDVKFKVEGNKVIVYAR